MKFRELLGGDIILFFPTHFSSPVLATRMPGGSDYLLLALVLFGFVAGLLAQLVFAILLLRRIGRGAAHQGLVLPVIAICISGFFFLCSLVGLAAGHGIGMFWTQAGWAWLLGCSLSGIFWAVVVMTRPMWPAFSLHFVRWVPILLSLLLPAGIVLPVLLHAAKVNAANTHAHRYVEKTIFGHFLGTSDLVYSADGKRLISVSKADKTPWPLVWMADSSERSHAPSYWHKEVPVAPHLCFVKGGLVWLEGRPGFNHGRLLFRDTARSGGKRKELGIRHAGALACTPDGKTVIVGSGLNTGKLSVFRFPAGQVLRQWSLPSITRHVAISHDGRFIAHDLSGSVQIRRVADGAVVRKLVSFPSGRRLSSMALSSKGDYLALGSENRTLEVWARTGPDREKPVLTEGVKGKYGSVQVLFSRTSEQLLATGGNDFVLARWSVGTWKVSQWFHTWPQAKKNRCRSPRSIHEMTGVDQDPLVVGCNRYADIVSLETGKRLQTLVGLGSGIDAISFTSQGGKIALGGRRQPLTIFRWKTGIRIAGDGARRLTGKAVSLAQSSTAGLVAVGMNDGNLALFKGNDPRLRSVHFPPPGRISGDILALTFSSDGRYLLSAGTRGLLRLWSVEKQLPLATQTAALKEKPVALAHLQDNRFLSLSTNGDLRRWKVKSHGLSAAGKRYRSGCQQGRSLAVFEEADRVAVGCGRGRIRLLSLNTMVETGATKQVHQGGVSALAFAPGGKILLSGGSDGRVLVWSLPNLKKHRLIFSPWRKKSGETPILKRINRIVFSPKGKKFVLITNTNHRNIHILSTTSLVSD